MAQALIKINKNGGLYKRPSEVETQIDEVTRLSLLALRARLAVGDRESAGYLRSETLVHLIRLGRRQNNQALIGAVFPVLLGRCERNLWVKVPDGLIPDAGDIRQQILDDLAELFAVDTTPTSTNALDFYECKFNRAFRALRIDSIRTFETHSENYKEVDLHPPDEIEESPHYDDALARITEAFRVPATHEWDAMRGELFGAIRKLPPDERTALVLVHGLGYKEESEDPSEETAATRCKCSGRTIRNRLTRAASKLARFKEFLEA